MKNNKFGILYTLPLLLWMTVFFVIPTIIIFVYSILTKGTYGGVKGPVTFKAYKIVTNPIFLKVVSLTIIISVAVTVITILISIPTAYYIARSKYKNGLLLLIIIPFWTNFLIRIYAWIAILGNNGFINSFLLKAGIIDKPIQLLYNPYAVIIITVYTYLPYAILPLYSTIEKFDFSLIEAARDLGATKMQSIFKVFLPNIWVGVVTAVIFTFIPALGSYAIPQLVGGKNSLMLGNIIARELTVTRNWPLASAMSVMLTVISMIGIYVFMGMNRKHGAVDDDE